MTEGHQLQPVLEVTGLTKLFYGSRALDGVDFELLPGEIHALAGENGAGKSTFIKILAGVHAADGGTIRIDGKAVDPSRDRLPIGFVHQDLAFAEELSVGENVAMMAGYPTKGGLIDWAEVDRRAAEIYSAMDTVAIDPSRQVASLSLPEKAILNIVRALADAPRVLILDEPTAALPEADSQLLFDAMRRLRARGTSMIYVSHRLNDFKGLCDRVTVFRDGRHISTRPMAGLETGAIVEDMLGRLVEHEKALNDEPDLGPEMLSVRDLKVDGRGPISFTVHRGEILGLVGLQGGGQEAIGRAIFGERPLQAGEIRLEGEPLPRERDISDTIAIGIGLLPGDRSAESVAAGLSLSENLFPNPEIVPNAWSAAPARERAIVHRWLDRFGVRPLDPDALIDWLSGGNQQKVCVARWVATGARVMVLEEPSAGVDIGAKIAIHDILRDLAAEGAALIVVSTDLEEVAALCSRVIVVDRGQAAAELSGQEIELENLTRVSSQSHASELAHTTSFKEVS